MGFHLPCCEDSKESFPPCSNLAVSVLWYFPGFLGASCASWRGVGEYLRNIGARTGDAGTVCVLGVYSECMGCVCEESNEWVEFGPVQLAEMESIE